MMSREELMRKAIELSIENVRSGAGGPFGAVISRGGVIFASGANRVTAHRDPTAHAEVMAIREACGKVEDFQLTGCEIFCSCEPCPMCLGAIYWARLDAVYFANTKADAAEIGFDDRLIYDELEKPPMGRMLETRQLLREEAIEAFELWKLSVDRIDY